MKKGIHYLTCKGMVDTDESAYSIFRLQNDKIDVIGFGRESDRLLEIR
jgi:manganese-dependent ADP-ribose/CDP-alcohol diphosphatase